MRERVYPKDTISFQMKALLTHPGTQHSHEVARALHRTGCLGRFHTTVALGEGGISKAIRNLVPKKLLDRAANRFVGGVPGRLVVANFFPELKALARLRSGQESQAVFHTRNFAFQKNIPASASEKADAVTCLDTTYWILEERCRELEISCILNDCGSTVYGDLFIQEPQSITCYKTALDYYESKSISLAQLYS